MSETDERSRRWTLALGVDADEEGGFALSASDRRMSDALTALYGDGDDARKKGRGGLGGSAPRVAKWLGDIREFFPAPVVQVIQKDAFERKGLRQMLIEPEFLATVEADVNLIADLVSLRGVMPDKTKETARIVIAKVVKELMERLERRTADAIRGALIRPSTAPWSSYNPALSARVAALGIPVFACTPDQFPDLMATALKREDVAQWAADADIKLIRAES
jgi:hypothetical protein